MNIFNVIWRQIALSQNKIGANYQVGIAFGTNGTSIKCLIKYENLIDEVLRTIDHRALNIDFDLGVASPSSINFLSWLVKQLTSRGLPLIALKLKRGDGQEFCYYGQVSERDTDFSV